MALETKTTNGTTYLQLDYGKKSMYIYSKDEKDGFEKHTNTKGTVTYRQYINAVTGKITGAYFRDNNFGGQDFVLVFTDGEDRYSVQMNIEDFVFTTIARSIKNIDVSKEIRMAIYESRGSNGDKSYFGVSLSYPNDLDKDGKNKLVEWGDELPKGKQLRNGKWDFSEAQDEAYGRVDDFIKENGFDKFEKNTDNSTTKEEDKPKKTTKTSTKKEKEDVEDDDDLPF